MRPRCSAKLPKTSGSTVPIVRSRSILMRAAAAGVCGAACMGQVAAAIAAAHKAAILCKRTSPPFRFPLSAFFFPSSVFRLPSVWHPDRHLSLAAVVPRVVRDRDDGAVAGRERDRLDAVQQIRSERVCGCGIERQADAADAPAVVDRLETIDDWATLERGLATILRDTVVREHA